MVSAIQKINLKDGAPVRLLITPSLFSIAHQRGISLEVEDYRNDTYGTLHLYTKIMWLAALNYIEVAKMDEPDTPDADFTFMDFEIWAGQNRKDFTRMMGIVIQCLRGDDSPVQDDGEDEKKK